MQGSLTGNRQDQRGGVLAIVLIVLGIIVGIVVLVALAGIWLWKSAENFPDDARPDIVLAAYQEFVDDIDATIAQSTTFYQAASKLEQASVPGELIYLGIFSEPENGIGMDEEKPIIARTTWSGHSSSIMNGTGHGTITTAAGKKAIIIIERPIENPAIGAYWRAYFPRADLPATSVSDTQ